MRIFLLRMMIWVPIAILWGGMWGYCAAEFGQDNFCGPRCVEYILKSYGKNPVDLIEIIRQCNWPDDHRGASMANLNRLLNENGIATRPLELSYDADLRWPHPVLVHIKASSGGNGHYVVWLDSVGAVSGIWDGLNGVSVIDNDILAENRSGNVILTAPHMDGLSSNCTTLGCRSLSRIGGLCLLVDSIIILGFVILLRWSVDWKSSTKKNLQRGVPARVPVD